MHLCQASRVLRGPMAGPGWAWQESADQAHHQLTYALTIAPRPARSGILPTGWKGEAGLSPVEEAEVRWPRDRLAGAGPRASPCAAKAGTIRALSLALVLVRPW